MQIFFIFTTFLFQELELEDITASGRKTLPPLTTSTPISSKGKRAFSTGVVHDVVMETSGRVFDAPTQVKSEGGYKKLKLDPLQGILNFVYKEMQNPSIVDTEGFKEMIIQVLRNPRHISSICGAGRDYLSYALH
jgi:hypothetical protein